MYSNIFSLGYLGVPQILDRFRHLSDVNSECIKYFLDEKSAEQLSM